MKRTLSFLLALIMTLSLFPAGVASAAETADVTVQAYQLAGNRLLELDGSVNEVYWLLDTPVGSSMLGALCDVQNVYVAFKTAAATAKFTVNGVVVDCTLGAAPKASLGTIAAKDGVYELGLPAKELNLAVQPGAKAAFSAAFGADSVKGELVLADYSIEEVASGLKLTGEDYFNGTSGEGTGNMTVTDKGVFTFKNDGDSYYQLTTTSTSAWASLSATGYMLSFEADFHDLPQSDDASKPMYNFGLFWFLRSGSARSDIAFWADENGQIMFCAKQATTADSRKNALPTGIMLGTPEAQNVRFRILLDQNNNITLYINGVKIGTLNACPPPSTTARNQFSFYVDHRKRTSERSVDVEISDLSYQEFSVAAVKSAENKVTYPTPVGLGVKDIQAYMRAGELKIDGTLKEGLWYLAHYPEHRTGNDSPCVGFGLHWDEENLYLGMQDFSKQTTQQLAMTVNNKVMVTADLAAGTATAGEFFFDPFAGTAEWAIPMSDIGLKGQYGEVAQYSVSASSAGGISVLTGSFTLSGETMLLGDTFDDLANGGYTVTGEAPGTRLEQGDGSANYVSDPDLTGNEIHQMFQTTDGFTGAPYALTVDMTILSLPAIASSQGWRGMCFELREPQLQSRFNFRDGGDGNVVMDILYQGTYVAHDTGLKMGDRAVIRMDVDKNNVTTMYVNGKQVAQYPAQDRVSFTINDNYPMPRMIIQSVNYSRKADNAGNLNEVNVLLHDMTFTQPTLSDPQMRLDTALAQVTEKVILANNSGTDNITSALNLPTRVSVSDKLSYPVTWKQQDLNGTPSKVIDLSTGKITPAATTSMVELVGSISDGNYSSEVVFRLQVKGAQTNRNVYFLPGDDAPATGAVSSASGVDKFVVFDTDHNSVIFDQGSAKRFNRVMLCDSDEFSRVSQNDLGVFVSNDGKTFTKVTGWMLHQSGKIYTLYNLDETARYVKVHSYQDNLNDPADTMAFAPSFRNNVADLIKVEYSDSLLGAKGKFAHTGSYTASNVTDKELRDEVVYITLEQLGAKTGEYRSDCADFRFTADGKQLPHWYDGEGGFYVRVFSVPAKGSTAVTAHWGNVTAGDVSDREAVFEAVYGNAQLIDLTEKTDLVNSGRAFTFPNGTVIAVSRNDNSELTAVFSYDGGRTFTPVGVDLIPDNHWGNKSGYGSFIWDEDLQRLFVVAYMPKKGVSGGYATADCRFVIVYTDDYGKTWSDPVVISDAAAAPATDNDSVIQNSKGRLYQLSYCDGLTMREADGAGPNVDYVISHSYYRPDGTFAGCALFSKDGGKTWIASEDEINMVTTIGHENGISETAFAQLDDGSLYIVARAQVADNIYFYESYSYDYGNTWTPAVPSKVVSTNTSPVMLPYGNDRLLMWAGNNALGQDSRRRFPMTLAISSDNYKTYDRSINLTFGTSFDTLEDSIERMTQPSLSVTPDGKEAFVCWTNLRQSTSVGVLLEEFDEMIYHTKGAYDAFESTAVKGEGWLLGDHTNTTSGVSVTTGGRVDVSAEQANGGSQSMKVLDDDANSRVVRVVRQVPSMRKGTIGASLYVPSTNTTDFSFEIKHAFNFTFAEFSIAGIAIKPDGTVYLCDGKNTVVGKVAPDSWNDFAIEFDMLGSKKGTLYINDKEVASFDLVIQSDRITAVEIGEVSGTQSVGSCVYVDDFYATEATLQHNGVRTHAAESADVVVAFDDVASSDWCAEAVAYATEKGLMSGYNTATFGANDTLTRAQVVQVLYNKEGTPALGGATHKFPDVPANQWFNNAVTWGAAKKVVSGYGDGRFGPNDTVTLEQAVVILWNYSGTPAAEASLDAIGAHSDWAANALRWAVKTGLLEGMPYSAVTAGATRAQTAQLLMNYLSK